MKTDCWRRYLEHCCMELDGAPCRVHSPAHGKMTTRGKRYMIPLPPPPPRMVTSFRSILTKPYGPVPACKDATSMVYGMNLH